MPRIVKSAKVDADNHVAVGVPNLMPEPPGPAELESAAAPQAEPDPAALRAAAQAQIEGMFAQARGQVTAWREEARQAGHQIGYAEGRQAASVEMAQLLERMRSLAEAAVGAQAKFLRDSQPEIGRLAVAIAEKILGRELTLNPSTITDIVAQVIDVANVPGECRIRVNPQDYDLLKPHWDAISSLQQPGNAWDLVGDKNIQRGGCVIEAGGGTIDAQLCTQLGQVAQALETIGS